MTTTDPRLGTVLRDGPRLGLRFVRTFPHPRETVWAALTESRHLRHWFPADLVGERHPGAPLRLPFWPEHVTRYGIAEPVVEGTVEAWEPPSRASWTWGGDLLLFELEEDGDGTRLTFTTWLARASGEDAASTAAGYHLCLDLLEDLLAGAPRPTAGIPDDAEAAMRARYRGAVGGP
ncbi:SRPBCC domain-containing protein [Cellulomonas wangsupingiae]|uniref:SRPBCC domain-containing protein n=1 Tax=Cellulomonas wangsupingiae TaxID=2968085 RepID=UPI00202EFFE1|nr:SRPBCC domain-containing protein [Cellulomonas wangsupingiae]MCM0641512.1 SRPBCC domain-containing protein [Cellulomonas wangsupingiae]